MNQNQLSLMVATDGSQASKMAFYQAVEFFEHQNLFSKLIVSHISDPSKDYLPFEYLSNTIYEDYRIELLSRYPQHKYQLIFETKRMDEENIRAQLMHLAAYNHSAYVVIGYHGRKGPKGDVTLLGQTVKHTAYNSNVPSIITKYLYKRDQENNKGFNFLVCVDGSNKSFQTLNAGIQLAFDKNDHLIICYAPSPDGAKFTQLVKSKVEEHMENIQRNWEFIALKEDFQHIERIIKFINFNERVSIDFVLFGINGFRAQLEVKNFFGSTAEELLTRAKANPIIVP